MIVKLTCWFFLLLLCTQAVYVLAIEGSSARGLSMAHGSLEDCETVRDRNQSIASVSRKGGKGKGVYGGANVVHRPNHKALAPPALVSPSFVIPLLILLSLVFIYA